MKTGPQPENTKLLHPRVVISIAVFVVVVVFAVLYAIYGTSKNSGQNNPQASWATYQSTQYGFKFLYPPSWGKPVLTASQNATGMHYAIAFTPPKSAAVSKAIGINMDTTDCKSGCQTKEAVQRGLKVGVKNFIKYDSTSYAFLYAIPNSKIDNLTDVQIVNLPKIKVTAAMMTFTRDNGQGCKSNKFAASSKNGCITESDYSTVDQVMKSLQAL